MSISIWPGGDTSLVILDEQFYLLARPASYVAMHPCGQAQPQGPPAPLVA
ncbi:MAG: hypothetical protein OXU40_02330 [Nitrospira sp.]|nr:hypothetical protein [Nitrospira sp.]